MRKRLFIVFSCLLLAGSPASVLGQPQKGWGLFGGYAQHRSTIVASESGRSDFTSGGLALGVDFQFPFGERFSLHPFLLTSAESTSGDNSEAGSSVDVLGVQARLWLTGRVFIGMHTGLYRQTRTVFFILGDASRSGDAIGFGAATGMEIELGPESSLLITAQYDAAKGLDVFADTEIDLTGFRIQGGLRFPFD